MANAYRSENESPFEGSIQLKTAEPSEAADQFGCRLPAPDGFARGVEENVWLEAGSANKTARTMDRIITKVTPFLITQAHPILNRRRNN